MKKVLSELDPAALFLIGSGTNLVDLFLQLFEILKGIGTAAGIAQDCGGVEHCHHVDAAAFEPLSVFFGDLEVFFDDFCGSNTPQTDNDFWPDQGDLISEITDAGVLLCVQRIAVLRWTAFDDVGDINVAFAAQINDFQHIVQ